MTLARANVAYTLARVEHRKGALTREQLLKFEQQIADAEPYTPFGPAPLEREREVRENRRTWFNGLTDLW